MELIYPEAMPTTRKELHNFIMVNKQKLILMFIARAADYLSTASDDDFWGRQMKAEGEYGEFKLMGIPAAIEGNEEFLDGVNYMGIEALQKHFMDIA